MKIIATLAPLPSPRAVDGLPCAICGHGIAASDTVTQFEADGLEFVGHRPCVTAALLALADECIDATRRHIEATERNTAMRLQKGTKCTL